MATAIYRFLDDLGTQEFINVITEETEKAFDDKLVNTITPSATADQIPTSKATLEMVTGVQAKIENINSRYADAKQKIIDLASKEGLNAFKTKDASNKITHLETKMITGPISQIKTPDDTVLYFQRDDVNDSRWNIYIWYTPEKKWLCVGNVEENLNDIYSKDETDGLIERFYRISFQKMTRKEIDHDVKTQYNNVLEPTSQKPLPLE